MYNDKKWKNQVWQKMLLYKIFAKMAEMRPNEAAEHMEFLRSDPI